MPAQKIPMSSEITHKVRTFIVFSFAGIPGAAAGILAQLLWGASLLVSLLIGYAVGILSLVGLLGLMIWVNGRRLRRGQRNNF